MSNDARTPASEARVTDPSSTDERQQHPQHPQHQNQQRALPLTADAMSASNSSLPLRPYGPHSQRRPHINSRPWSSAAAEGAHGHGLPSAAASMRMQYRSRPVSVAVDPVSLVISECINITSAIQKYARSQHLSVSAILGGGAPNVTMATSFKFGATSAESTSRRGDGAGTGSGTGRRNVTRAGGGPRSSVTAGGADGDFGPANRWGLRGKKGKSMADNPLISGYGRLRQELAGVKNIHAFDSLMLLYPFLQTIQAKGTAAPITILALRAVRKFLAYGFICPESPRFPLAMQALSQAITHCQFDISDSAQEEVVLLMILNLMEDMLSGPGGDILSDESVCDMMGRGLTICSRPRFSEVLRQTAEATMVRMCQIIFEDLKHLEEEAGEEVDALDRQTDADMDSVKMVPGADAQPSVLPATVSDPATHSTTPTQTAAAAAAAAATAVPEPGNRREGNGTKTNGERGTSREGDATAASSSSSSSSSSDTDEAETRPLKPSVEEDSSSAIRPSSDSPTDETDRKSTTSATEETESVDFRPYSLPSVRELFRVLVDFLEPNQRKQQPDTMRVMALRIIHVALEVAGPSIARHPALASIAQDRLCCYLFQLVRSENMAILQEALTVASTLLSTCRGVLKLQQELYLAYLISCLHPAVDIPRESNIDPSLYEGIPQAPKLVKPPPSQTSSGRSTPVPVKDRQKLGMEGGMRKPEARQAMVENIGVLARMPTFMVELFVNYDCDTDRADLCEDLVGLLSRNALPDSATWSTTSVPPLCLDALLRFVQFMAQRADEPPVYEGYADPATLRESRARKKMIIRGANKFNENPKGGLALLQDKGIIDDVSNPLSVSRFLHGTSRVSKKVLGEFLSKKGNEEVLAAFLELFDFEGKRVDEALRTVLEAFRLPGESPLIERIISSFSERYCSGTMPVDVADKDAVYILTYAIIMLNTDQHNPNVGTQKRMTITDFARNLRGQNGGKDFAPEYLQKIFDSIKSNEIILPEEHNNKHAFDYAWREVLLKTEAAGPLVLVDTNIYDADMFATTWRPIVATLSYVFMSATDDTVFSRVIQGFDECARIASTYGNTEALDQIVYCLSHMSTLAQEAQLNTTLNTEVQVDGSSVMVSELAVKLGRNFRAQLAALVLFRVVTENEHILRRSWKHVIRIWLNLFENSLIPAFFSSNIDLSDLPPIPLQSPGQVIDRGTKHNESGFFSAFTSYISSYAADDPPEPSDEELESTLCAIDCVNACHVGDVFANVANLTGEALETLVDSLLEQIPEDNGAGVVIKVKAENVPPTSPANNTKAANTPTYDAAPVYILEFCTVLALRDESTVKHVGKRVVDALQEILRDVSRFHPILIGRATYYLFSLLQASYNDDFVRVPVLLHAVSSFSKDTLKATGSVVLQGLKLCIAEPGPLRSEIMTSPDFWAILGTLADYEGSAATVFEILESGVSGSPPAILADNYEAAIVLCNMFASAASVGALAEQQMDRKNRRVSRAPKQEKPSSENAAVQRGIKAINIIYNMTSRIPHLMKQSHLESNEAWSAYWLPIFQALTTQCTNPCREIRHLAFSSLQRSLLSPELTSSDHREWTAIFSEVLFPLILKLLRPEVFSTDRDGMSETRVQAASLLCKVFLQYLVLLSAWDGMLDLWLKIIDIMDRLMNSGQGDSLEEAVPENLKNVLLFMASSGYLVAPSIDKSKEGLWVETWKRIDRFLPDLQSELALGGTDAGTVPPQPLAAERTEPPPAAATEHDQAAEVATAGERDPRSSREQ
ncbi:guanine nucleotide exchange factor [Niveomyces insectorum RCEF 264]|uniref:Guanine nucleotide exchange factor n=1 Tax=Niveomyces insectorum RCEF 264 TaxID=1081102 RepID=A0A168A7E3_9HYPO|nr:guanine nucleotide exchange factor [Niveomyces insectorum RCEF 264]